MPYSASLVEYQPSPRYGVSVPWTQVRFEEAATRSGPFAAVETQTLDPAYTDPESPPLYDFTTELITVYPGWLRLVFLDVDGTEEPTDPVFVGSSIRPAVSEVALLMPDRTTIIGGGEAGTFNTDTRPTSAQVEQIIDMVLDTVEALVPAEAGGEVLRSARTVVSLNTAILVETGHFGEQTEVDDARVAVWERLLERHLTILNDAARDDLPGGVRAYGVPITTVMSDTWPLTSELLP